jgi:outer membrane immunogenic protein
MKQKLLISALFAVASTSAFAQSKSFEGAYGQLGIGYESVMPSVNNYQLTTGTTVIPLSSSANTANSFVGTVTLGYMFAVQKDFLLGLGAEYSPLEGQSANSSLSSPNIVPTTVSGNYKKKNSYNIFLSPATPVGKDGLLYGKVGYTGAQINDGSTTDYSGYSLGVGYKQFISGGFYGFGEANYASYGNKSESSSGRLSNGNAYTITGTSSANSYNFLVGVGYKF